MEQMVLELITFLQAWGLWKDVMILADGRAFSYSESKEDVCLCLPHVQVSACVHPEDYTSGITDERDCDGNLIWRSYSNPEHILDIVFEGQLYTLLNYGVYEGIRRADISPGAWDYIFAHTDILEDEMYERYGCSDASELLELILEDKFDNPDYTVWDPLVFDTWEEYQRFENGEAYPDGDEELIPNYQRYGTYAEYLKDMELSEQLTVEDVIPIWEEMVVAAKQEFIKGNGVDDTISFQWEAGPVNHIRSEFDQIFDRYGLWYDLGFAWTLTCYRK